MADRGDATVDLLPRERRSRSHPVPRLATVLISALTIAAVALTAAPSQAAPATENTVGGHGSRFSIYVAGDSTASIYDASLAPRTGWGQALPVFAGPKVTIQDEALSGASSKSFVDLGLLDHILATIKTGDYLLISFGHNDEKADEPRHTDPYTTYQDYLRLYLDGARSRGAHPVLVTPVERRRFDADGHALFSHGEYPEAMRQLGATEHVPVVDLTTASRDLWEQLGPDGTQDEFLWLDPGENANYPDGVQDNTHFQTQGAVDVARLIGRSLRQQRLLPPGSLVHLDRARVPTGAIVWPAPVPAG
jgi:lysophospholipase L1-like esterase